jgi:hypothetical protein
LRPTLTFIYDPEKAKDIERQREVDKQKLATPEPNVDDEVKHIIDVTSHEEDITEVLDIPKKQVSYLEEMAAKIPPINKLFSKKETKEEEKSQPRSISLLKYVHTHIDGAYLF